MMNISFIYNDSIKFYQVHTITQRDIDCIQKQLSQLNNDPDMVIVTHNHFDFFSTKKGNSYYNIEYIEGINEQTCEHSARDVFDYNDLINYFE